MKYLLFLCLICSCLAANIYLNPQADCSPPQGCDFLSPSTWVDNVVPTSGNDSIYITRNASKSFNSTLVVGTGLVGVFHFKIQVLVIQDAEVVFDSSLAGVYGQLIISNGHLLLRNNTAFEVEEIVASNSSYISLHQHSRLTILSNFVNFYLPEDTTLSVHNSSLYCMQSSSVYGSVYAFNDSKISFGNIVDIYGDIFADSSSTVGAYNMSFYGPLYEFYNLTTFIVYITGSLQISSYLKITNSLTLGEDALLVVGGQFSSNTSEIGQIFSNSSSVLQVNSTNLAIGGPSNLTRVSFQILGNSNIYANQTIFGEILTAGNPTLHITGGPSALTKDINVTALNIIVRNSTANFAISSGVTLATFDCITNYGVLDIYGTVDCISAPLIANTSTSVTNLYGTLNAATAISNNAFLVVLSSSQIGGPLAITGGTLRVDPRFTLNITDFMELINATIDVNVDKNTDFNDSFMVQVISASLFSVSLTTSTPKDDRPTETITYNLLSSSTNINGEVIADELDRGYLHLEYPSPNVILFKYRPPAKSDTLPLWAYIVIGVVGFLIILVAAGVIIKSCMKKNDYKEIGK